MLFDFILEAFSHSGSHAIEPIMFDIGIIIILATLLAVLLKIFKQPLIPAYVLAGFLLGPYGLALITSQSVIQTLSEMGVAFLLFVVGIEMDFDRLKSIGLIATIGGSLQIIILGVFGWLIGIFLGLSSVEAVYCGLIVAFSSTMVVIKLLGDKAELDTLHGRIVIGFLLMEDIFAILTLLILSNFNTVANGSIAPVLGVMFLKIAIILFVSWILAKFVFPPLFKVAADNQEMLFLLAITTCFVFAFFSNIIGLSIAIGAFIAGLSLANLPYNYEIMAKVKALLMFFTTIFFASLGMKIRLVSFSALILPLIIFVLFISIGKPFITSIVCSLFGYKRRTALLTSISVAQTSEFSLIIVALGMSPLIAHLGPSSIVPSLAIFLAIITMVITSYTIKFDEKIYDKIKHFFGFLNKIGAGSRELDLVDLKNDYDVLLIGHDRIGYTILQTLLKQNRKVLVIDYNPEVVRQLVSKGIDCIYGDVSDLEVLERVNVKKLKFIISTVNESYDNIGVMKHVKKMGSKAIIFVTSTKVDDALELYDHGADYVILPHFLGGHHVSVMLEEETFDLDSLLKNKLNHIEELNHRKKVGHEHPRTK